MGKIYSWYKPRHYPHFDKFISERNSGSIIKNPEEVAKHGFMPFISFESIEPRYKPGLGKNVDKVRPLSCSSHVDSVIFSFYGDKLKDLYEKKIHEFGLDKSVIAYRKFPGGKCNIDFSNEVFELVKNRTSCVAIALDVEKFFDTINHKILKDLWQKILGVDKLPDDHFAVFKAITKFSKVKREDLEKIFNISKKSKKFKGPYCTPKEFREKVADEGYVQKNKKDFGIPQGSPISALLSNIYMLETDKIILEETKNRGAIYRRYSDDVLLICNVQDKSFFMGFLPALFQNIRLCISDEKTQISTFQRDGSGTLSADKPLQYLGFEFDGNRKLIRSKTISKYYGKMITGVNATVSKAHKLAKIKGSKIGLHKTKLFERYSHLGKRNFITYAKRASEKMNDEAIWKQVNRSWKYLNSLIGEKIDDTENEDMR